MTATIQDVIKTANEWTPGCGRWQVFEDMPTEPKHLRWVYHGAKLLAIAQENGDPVKIARERASLMYAVQSYMESIQAPEQHQGTPATGTQIALGIGAGLAVAAMARSGLGRSVARQAVGQVAYRGFRDLFGV
jgi:hypothetical protein